VGREADAVAAGGDLDGAVGADAPDAAGLPPVDLHLDALLGAGDVHVREALVLLAEEAAEADAVGARGEHVGPLADDDGAHHAAVVALLAGGLGGELVDGAERPRPRLDALVEVVLQVAHVVVRDGALPHVAEVVADRRAARRRGERDGEEEGGAGHGGG